MSEPSFRMIDGAPQPVAPFSHIVEVDGWYFLTGQMPTFPDDPDKPLPEGIEAQTRRVMDNLALILGKMGLDFSHVVQCRCFLTEFERDYATFNDTYQTFFPKDRRPARTTVGVTVGVTMGAGVAITRVVVSCCCSCCWSCSRACWVGVTETDGGGENIK